MPGVLFVLSTLLGRGSRRASVESDQPGRTSRPDGGGFRPWMDEGGLGTPTRSKPAQSPCGSPDRGTLSGSLSRRSLIVAGLAGTAAVVGVPIAKAAATTSVWGLDPYGSGQQGCACSACAACRGHAANKIFASPADAHSGRAHPYCKCEVTDLGSVQSYVHDALFVDGGGRASVDRRWQWVQAALASAPPIPPPTPPSMPVPGSGVPTPVTNETSGAQTTFAVPRADPTVLAAAGGVKLRAAWIRRLAPGRRVLYVQLEAARPVEATIGLSRHRRLLARRTVPTVQARQTVRIPLGPGVAHGPAQLHVVFRGTHGSAHGASRMLSVPAKQPRGPARRF